MDNNKENILLKGIKYKLNKYNFNDNFDKELLISLSKLKKVNYSDYLIDLLFTYKNIVFLHRLLEKVNKIVIFSTEPMFFDGKYTIFYKYFYKIYIDNFNYIKNYCSNCYKDLSNNNENIVKLVFNSIDVSFLLKEKYIGIFLCEYGLVKTPYEGAIINNFDDTEFGFYIDFFYGRNEKELQNSIKNNKCSYRFSFYLTDNTILITSIYKRFGEYNANVKKGFYRLFFYLLSKFDKKIIGLGNKLAFSRNEKGYGGIYDTFYKSYNFKYSNGKYLTTSKKLDDLFVSRKCIFNIDKEKLVNKIYSDFTKFKVNYAKK